MSGPAETPQQALDRKKRRLDAKKEELLDQKKKDEEKDRKKYREEYFRSRSNAARGNLAAHQKELDALVERQKHLNDMIEVDKEEIKRLERFWMAHTEHDERMPSPFVAVSPELPFSYLDLLDWRELTNMREMNKALYQSITYTKRFHDIIEKEETRWKRGPRPLFKCVDGIYHNVLIIENNIWLHDHEKFIGKDDPDNITCTPAGDKYKLASGTFAPSSQYCSTGPDCAYFQGEDKTVQITHFDNATTSETLELPPFKNMSMTQCDELTYLAIDNVLRCYKSDKSFGTVHTFTDPIIDRFANINLNDAVVLHPLDVVSDRLVTTICSKKGHPVVVVWDGIREIEVEVENMPCMVAFSSRTLAIVCADKGKYPSVVSLRSNTIDEDYSHVKGEYSMEGICDIVADGNGAFIVRTKEDCLYRLTTVKGFQKVAIYFMDDGDLRSVERITSMRFYNGDLIVTGYVNNVAIAVVFDPDYNFVSTFISQP